jgi:hypothetical protein
MTLIVDLIGGNCPLQAEGTINGVPFYFRARGGSWSMGIGQDPVGIPHRPLFFEGDSRPTIPDEWFCECTWGKWPDAGWMPEPEARRLVEWCAEEYVAGLKRAADEASKAQENHRQLSLFSDEVCA